MKITRAKLKSAVKHNILSAKQADDLYNYLKSLPETGPRFDFTHVLYYMGGLIAIGAMTLFMNLGWESFGGKGIVVISLIYAFIGLRLTYTFQNKGYGIPAGICAAFVIAMAPLAIYGFQQAMGWWPDDTTYQQYHRYIKWHWIYLELGTLAIGAIIAYLYRFPFLVMPISATLWYMSMDLAPLVAGDQYDFLFKAKVSMWFGLVQILGAFWVDFRSRKSEDYAFWLYIFGVIAFWGGLTSQHSDSEIAKFIYFVINVSLIGVGVIVVRRVFVVFGAIGSSIYIGHLAYDVFQDSWAFPIVLTALGLAIIYLGILWQKNEERMTRSLRGIFPEKIQQLLEKKE